MKLFSLPSRVFIIAQEEMRKLRDGLKMVMTENTDFASWFGLRENVVSTAIWPNAVSMPLKRHPSRRKPKYRLRGTRLSTASKPERHTAEAVVHDHQGTWQAKTRATKKAKKSRELRLAACFSAAFTGFATVGVLTVQQVQVSSNVSSNILEQMPVTGLVQTTVDEFTGLPAVNVERATQIVTRAPSSTMTMSELPQPTPPTLTTDRAPQPAILDRAPQLLAAPLQVARANLVSRGFETPEMLVPAALNAPALPQLFDCRTCAPAFPQFGQVMFDVQSSDIGAANVQALMASLGQYQSTVRQSQIDVTTSQVRFYRPSDAPAAASLAAIYNADLVDLTWFAPADDIAKIDVILAKQNSGSAPDDGQ
ncbi:hypothetical protein AN191_03840 [Loktanella sp. 5RATIMAR09]|uniref:hypothetical protein n=1 Tax=Loktanella sp. 5RATIMAR09 TaxID=1225655 RepID=UPI0006EBA539|nr:hypothetical protein [Loktanella sp. 5RATIMAR09]KQI73039.1 hypothetical protein AN191_03840 [Loktanella sp. 5RATIMAR09]